jgi:hypothetical protein
MSGTPQEAIRAINSDGSYKGNELPGGTLVISDVSLTDGYGVVHNVPGAKNWIAPVCGSTNDILPLNTGQLTSFATGDDANLKRGRLTDFFTLVINNIFGNKNRFTDELGLQVYANHATQLGWFTTLQAPLNWANAIASANAFSLVIGAGTLSGFAIPNVNELLEIMNWGQICLNYNPFNINPGTSAQMWTSTTNFGSISAAIRVSYQNIPGPTSSPKTGLQPFLMCRINVEVSA